jgi:CheY-like chemotaxis protein
MQCKLVASDEVTGRAFVDAFEDVPVVLMSEGGATDEVMRAVTLGAVDFLDKPLSLLKLKNIWQHSVRRMMQRTSLYDSSPRYAPSAPAYSEPVGALSHQPSMSNCLPSSMTAPIALIPSVVRRSCDKPSGTICTAPAPHRSSVDSPGTPSAGDCEPAESLSAGSVHQLNDPSFFSCMDASGALGGDNSNTLLDGESKAPQSVLMTRAPMASKPSSFGPLVPVPPASQWPQLPVGCVWGTPVGGPLPPPLSNFTAPTPPSTAAIAVLPGAPTLAPLRISATAAAAAPTTTTSAASVLLKSSRSINSIHEHVSLPSLCGNVATEPSKLFPSPQPIPEGFLCLTKAKEEATTGAAPLGLKLRKSNSLLDLINATLSTSSTGSEGTAVTTAAVGGGARSF